MFDCETTIINSKKTYGKNKRTGRDLKKQKSCIGNFAKVFDKHIALGANSSLKIMQDVDGSGYGT